MSGSRRSVAAARLLSLIVLGAAAAVPSAAEPRTPLPAFRETFETFDERRWFVSHGWTNGGVVNVGWSKDQVRHRPGRIDLSLAPIPAAGTPHSAGEIQARGWGGYGRYEATVRAAAGGPGMVTGFFVYTGPHFDDPHDEIDFEWLGKDTRAVQLNHFSDGRPAGGVTVPLDFDAAEEFSTYRFDWLPDRIDWYVDGRLVHSADGSAQRLPEPPAKLFFDIWAGRGRDAETWLGGRFADPGRPVTASVRCVSYVPLGESGEHCSDLRE